MQNTQSILSGLTSDAEFLTDKSPPFKSLEMNSVWLPRTEDEPECFEF